MAQAFGHPAFPVDTHIHRLAQLETVFWKNVGQTEKDLKRHFPKERWNELHLQIIFTEGEYCTARNCFGLECTICRTCFPGRKSKVATIKS